MKQKFYFIHKEKEDSDIIEIWAANKEAAQHKLRKYVTEPNEWKEYVITYEVEV